MPTRSHAARLGGTELGSQRHVVGVFEGPEEATGVLVPFVVESLERGDRVIHFVEDREAYLERLTRTIDVSDPIESGQLDIRTWDESYLRNGGFSGSRMLAYVRRSLREGAQLGFSATRLIGDMQWAQDDVPGVDELVAYESQLHTILARPLVSVVCVYDSRSHSARRIAGIMAVHEAAIVGGTLQPGPRTGAAATPRERIMAAAWVLFAENGASRTGVDTLIEAAGVAKATFYRHFPSKDALIVAWLQDPRTGWFDRARAQAESRAATPGEVVPRLFEAVADWLDADDFLGCPYLNTAVEFSNPGHPASEAIRNYLAEIGRYLEQCVAAAGHRDSSRLARELHALLAGSISLAVPNRTSAYALAARDAAIQLLDGKRTRGNRPSR
jgi:AcrR family transcriptional regulator